MKSRKMIWPIAMMITVIATYLPVIAQVPAKHHHYKLIDLGTFGGTQSYVNEVGSYAPVLNDRGTVAGWADTAVSDPYPNFCFNGDCFVSYAFQWQDGNLIDLRALNNRVSSAATWISTNGLVAGVSENGETDPLYPGLPQLHAVLWKDGNIIDLKTLPVSEGGGYQSEANAVNNFGQVVGATLNTIPDDNSMETGFYWLWGGISPAYSYQTRAFIWDQESGMHDLGTLGGTDAAALLVNDRGEIVGVSYTDSTASDYCSKHLDLALTTGTFLWKNGKMKNLGNLGGTCTLPIYLSEQGQVLGISTLPGDKAQHPFLWPGKNGKIKDLGTLGGTLGAAWGITPGGEIAGWASTKGNQANHAFLWRNDKMRDLGTVDGDPCSYGLGINRKRQVIGASASGTCLLTAPRAFLWEEGGPMVDLNTLITPDSDLHLEIPETINDRGEIAGTGSLPDGNERAFLLIPCDENHPGVEGCDYSMVDATSAEVPQVNPERATPPNSLGGPHPNGLNQRMRRHSSKEEAPIFERDDIGTTFSPSGADSARRCVKQGGQCYLTHLCCPGLVCAAASDRTFCDRPDRSGT